MADRYAIELAEAVLEAPLFRMALEVIDCEKHTYSRATELASAVLEACGAAEQNAAENPEPRAEAVNGAEQAVVVSGEGGTRP